MATEAQEIRLGIVTFVRQSLGIGAYTVAAATGARYPRLLGLRSAAERALGRNQLDDAASLAAELLSLAEQFSTDWYYGNAVYYGHLVLGEIALARGDKSDAAKELLAAGHSEGRLSSTRSAQTCGWPKPSCRQASGPQYSSSSCRVSRSGN